MLYIYRIKINYCIKNIEKNILIFFQKLKKFATQICEIIIYFQLKIGI